MRNLQDALEILKECLSTGTKVDVAVRETAEDYGLHPTLLKRKFEEQHGVSPESYSPPISDETLSRRRARKRALSQAWEDSIRLSTLYLFPVEYKELQEGKEEWMNQNVSKKYLGTIFEDDGSIYAFAGLSGNMCVKAIPVNEPDGTVDSLVETVGWMCGNRKLKFDNEQDAYLWLAERTLVAAEEMIG